MAYIRKLPSGNWQATIRGADGQKHTKSDPLKKVVATWAKDEETKVSQGRWHDPRRGRQTVGEWVAQWLPARVVEAETRRGDRSVMATHIAPHWKSWRLDTITSFDVQQWIRRLEKAEVGAHAIRRAYNLFVVMLEDAVSADILPANPCRKGRRRAVHLPATPPKMPAWFTREQVDRIRQELDGNPRHRGHSGLTELMCLAGLRWGEAAAVAGGPRPDGNPVDWLRRRITVVGELDQNGRWKEYPKTSSSRREVPVPSHVVDLMSGLLVGREQTARVFVAPRGGDLSGANYRKVWYAAIDRVNAAGRRAGLAPVPSHDPYTCRHTCASWLVQDGVPLYQVQALLGHERASTTERYAHLDPEAHGRIEDAWSRIVAHQRRTGTPGRSGNAV